MTPNRQRRPWNHNVQYHPLIRDAVRTGAQRGLDVGCGVGVLARELRERIPVVIGIDPDPASINAARDAGGGVDYVLGDFLTEPFEPSSFDVIAARRRCITWTQRTRSHA